MLAKTNITWKYKEIELPCVWIQVLTWYCQDSLHLLLLLFFPTLTLFSGKLSFHGNKMTSNISIFSANIVEKKYFFTECVGQSPRISSGDTDVG